MKPKINYGELDKYKGKYFGKLDLSFSESGKFYVVIDLDGINGFQLIPCENMDDEYFLKHFVDNENTN